MTAPTNEPVRLSRRVAELARCSRSEAERYIADGWVSVDGQVVEEPHHRVLDEQVTLDPDARLTPTEPATILLHKPAGHDLGDSNNPDLSLLAAAARSTSDHTGIRILKRHSVRLVALFPLEASASGLQPFSQDARVLRRVAEEAPLFEQEYVVEVTGQAAPDALQRLGHGLVFKGRALPRARVSWANEDRLRFAIKDVRPGQLVDMCTQVGLSVVSCRRLRIGKIALAKMPPGEWRYLPVSERF